MGFVAGASRRSAWTSVAVTRVVTLARQAALWTAVAATCAWLARPLEGPAGPDAASSVLFFERIASGRHLETWVNTTPKPLLTLVLGGLHAATGGWAAGAIASVVVAALGIVLVSELVRRVAGRSAAAFACVGLVGLTSLQAETAWSYGLPWSLALWAAAGLALQRPRRVRRRGGRARPGRARAAGDLPPGRDRDRRAGLAAPPGVAAGAGGVAAPAVVARDRRALCP